LRAIRGNLEIIGGKSFVGVKCRRQSWMDVHPQNTLSMGGQKWTKTAFVQSNETIFL
jgi:hypothetical protein